MTLNKTYQSILKEELESRKSSNEGTYSLRKMAGELGLSPSYLSMILSGKRKLNEKNARELVKGLDWPQSKKKYFIDLIRYEQVGDSGVKEQIIEREFYDEEQRHYKELSKDTFCAISQWHHNAILILISTEDCLTDFVSISKMLGISRVEAEIAIDRLIRLGLLERSDETLKMTHLRFAAGGAPSEAVRKFHRQMLDKAARSLEEQTIEERDITGLMVATDPKLIPEAKERIREFRRTMIQFLSSGQKRVVYHLSSQLFRVDKDN